MVTVLSQDGRWRLECTDDLFQVIVDAELAWQAELKLSEGVRRAYLSDQGWSVVETQGQDWGEVLVVSPKGEVAARIALTDSQNRPTWPPSHLQQGIFSPGGWPWNDGGKTPHFFATDDSKEFFWWLLPADQRLAFGFHPARMLDWREIESLQPVMKRLELSSALSLLKNPAGEANELLRVALSVLLQQQHTDELSLLLGLGAYLQRTDVRKTLVPPYAELYATECLLKLALWNLHGEARPTLPALDGLNSKQVFALAGPPDYAGWWDSDDHTEKGEFWDYYQTGREVVRLLWEADHRGDKIRRSSREDISPHWINFRTGQLVKGWIEDRYTPYLDNSYPPESDSTPGHPIMVRPDEVKKIEIFGHHLALFPVASEKATIVGPYETDGPVARLLRALETPYREASPKQFGLSRPQLQVEFSACVDDDNPSFLVRLHLNSGSLLQLKTDSYHAHMLPWRCRLDGGEVIKTYNREISLAVAELLGEDFLDRHRLMGLGRFLKDRRESDVPIEARLWTYQPQPPPTDPDVLDENGKTALMRASKDDNNFQELVQSGADLEIRGQQGLTGLQMACLWGGAEEVERWAKAGANLETPNESGHTALMVAANLPEILRILLTHGALVNAADTDGDTALDHAIDVQNIESIEVLLTAGAISTRAQDHALDCVAKAELEAERQHAYEQFHTPAERQRSLAEREATIAEMEAKYPQYSWARNPYEDKLTRAREILARIDGGPIDFKSRIAALWAGQSDLHKF